MRPRDFRRWASTCSLGRRRSATVCGASCPGSRMDCCGDGSSCRVLADVAAHWRIPADLLVIAGVFPAAVRSCAATLSARPLSSFFAGILTLLLIGPICAVLAVSVVGVIVIPFALCAVMIGWVVGKVGVADWIGGGLIRGADSASRGSSLLTMVVGFAVITVTYMVPGLGLAAWALVGLLGVGTATLTFFGAIKREGLHRSRSRLRPWRPHRCLQPISTFRSRAARQSARRWRQAHSFPRARLRQRPTRPPTPAWAPARAPPPRRQSAPITATRARPVISGLTRAPRFSIGSAPARSTSSFSSLPETFWIGGTMKACSSSWRSWYFIAFIAWKGTTVGGIVCSLRVIRTDGQPVRPVDSVVRALSSLFSIAALGIGFFWILLAGNRDRQAWHDKIAGTLVIRVPRDFPI